VKRRARIPATLTLSPAISFGGGWPCYVLQDDYNGLPRRFKGKPGLPQLIVQRRESRAYWAAKIAEEERQVAAQAAMKLAAQAAMKLVEGVTRDGPMRATLRPRIQSMINETPSALMATSDLIMVTSGVIDGSWGLLPPWSVVTTSLPEPAPSRPSGSRKLLFLSLLLALL